LAFEGFETIYSDSFSNAPSYVDEVATRVSSGTRDETYGWLGSFPQIRKWVGARYINNLSAHKFKIVNELFESTIAVKRDDMEDDRMGIYTAMFREIGWLARQHPDELVFGLLADGLTGRAYDGKPFFSDEHSYENADGVATPVSNMAMGGDGPTWYLLDTSRQVRPLVWQVRQDYEFERPSNTYGEHIFTKNEYLFGVRARVNAGYGLWQLAYASNEPLTEATYEAARASMQAMRGDGGRVLGVMPNTLVVPPTLEGDALRVVNTEYGGAGASNPWKGTAKPIVTPFLPGEAA
jgi:phage major head subunit gpT-like protein